VVVVVVVVVVVAAVVAAVTVVVMVVMVVVVVVMFIMIAVVVVMIIGGGDCSGRGGGVSGAIYVSLTMILGNSDWGNWATRVGTGCKGNRSLSPRAILIPKIIRQVKAAIK
jgi:hypothetical protein